MWKAEFLLQQIYRSSNNSVQKLIVLLKKTTLSKNDLVEIKQLIRQICPKDGTCHVQDEQKQELKRIISDIKRSTQLKSKCSFTDLCFFKKLNLMKDWKTLYKNIVKESSGSVILTKFPDTDEEEDVSEEEF